MRTVFVIALIAASVILGGYGIWLIATRDVQGGRHEAGALLIAVALIAATAGAALFFYSRRRDRS
jgi:hypothetical protein